MYTHENYTWGLVAYGIGFALALPLWFKLTRLAFPWPFPRTLARLLFAVLLLTPVRAYTDMDFLAPAWLVAFFEFFKPTSVDGPARALTPLTVALAVAFALALAWRFLPRLGGRRSSQDSGGAASREGGEG